MLILSRKKNESIMIGQDIEITVVEVDGDQVKIGIQAPDNIDIFRKEIYLSIQEENSKAVKLNEDAIKKLFKR
ncbi:carbon storage regulator CsrA [Bacillus massilinigeriensis]|uniref:carbon storage regulator CsrA n=1 Tax=Bacillus massilionigeriensis TaxID=1805475 RepID=UPI00096AFADB|nr:carbon storage regulator CsrA [Bacillus massilionigeriensis]